MDEQPLLMIGMDGRGALIVQGCIDDKVRALGLLELAKAMVLAHQPKPQPLVVPALVIPSNGRGQ